MVNNIEQPAQAAGAESFHYEAGFLDASALADRLGVSVGTIRNWTNAGALPAIRLDCGRLVRYHWPSVESALLRAQRSQ